MDNINDSQINQNLSIDFPQAEDKAGMIDAGFFPSVGTAPCPSCGYCPACGRKNQPTFWPNYGPVWCGTTTGGLPGVVTC